MPDDGTLQATLPTSDSSSSTTGTSSSPGGFDTTKAVSDVQRSNDALTEFSKNVIQSNSRIGADLPKLVEQYGPTHQNFNDALTGFVQQVDKSKNVIADANTNILASKNVPGFVADIMGLFGDHRFQPDYQKEVIQGETKNLELTNQKVQGLANLDSANLQAINLARSGQETVLRTGLEIAQNERAGIQTQIALKTQKQIEAHIAVEGMTVEQLSAAAKNPEMLTAKNPDITPGMIQTILQQKQVSGIALQHASVLLDESKTSLEKNKLGLVQTLIQTGISNMSSQDLQAHAEDAAKNGGYSNIKVGDHTMKVPATQFTSALAGRQEAINNLYKSNQPVDTAIAENRVIGPEIDEKSSQLARNPYVTAFVDPVKVAEVGRNVAIARQLEQTNPLSANDTYKKALTSLEGFQKQAIDNAKPEEKSGLTQYFNTGGRIDDSTAASDLLVSSVKNAGASPLGLGDTYGIGDAVARKSFESAMYATKQALPGLGNGGIGLSGQSGNFLGNLTKAPPSEKEVFEHMMAGDNGKVIKNAVQGNLQNKILYGVIRDLGTDYPDRTGIQAFKNIMQNGDWADVVKTNGQLDVTKIYAALASDPKNMDILISKLNDSAVRQGFAKNDAAVNNTPLHAAYRQRLFNNDVTSVFNPLVAQATIYYNQAKQNSAKQATASAQAVQEAIQTQKTAQDNTVKNRQPADNFLGHQPADLSLGPKPNYGLFGPGAPNANEQQKANENPKDLMGWLRQKLAEEVARTSPPQR